MKRPALAILALSLLALLFGWETRQALLATPGGHDNAASPPAEEADRSAAATHLRIATPADPASGRRGIHRSRLD